MIIGSLRFLLFSLRGAMRLRAFMPLCSPLGSMRQAWAQSLPAQPGGRIGLARALGASCWMLALKALSLFLRSLRTPSQHDPDEQKIHLVNL